MAGLVLKFNDLDEYLSELDAWASDPMNMGDEVHSKVVRVTVRSTQDPTLPIRSLALVSTCCLMVDGMHGHGDPEPIWGVARLVLPCGSQMQGDDGKAIAYAKKKLAELELKVKDMRVFAIRPGVLEYSDTPPVV